MNDSSLSIERFNPIKLFTANHVKKWDQECIRNGFTEDLLVEISGQKISGYIETKFPQPKQLKILFLCGNGNNAADALVAMRCLHLKNHDVRGCLLPVPSKASSAFQNQINICKKENISLFEYSIEILASQKYDLIVDGVFGVGFRPPLSAELKKIFSWVNNYGATIIAVDIPSGVSSDQIIEKDRASHIQADITLCLDSFKYCFLMPYLKQNPFGEIVVLNLCIPKYIDQTNPTLTAEKAHIYLSPKRYVSKQKPNVHKFQKGHCLILGGSKGKLGALQLASRSAIEMGCGWVGVGVSPRQSVKTTLFRESVVFETMLDEENRIDTNLLSQYIQDRKPNSILIGPGWMKNFLEIKSLEILANYTRNGGVVILDAGATHKIMDQLPKYNFNPTKTLLLPHPGEWKKMGSVFENFSLQDADSILQLQTTIHQNKIPATLVYKSSSPIVFDKDKKNNIWINHFPNHLAAVAGMGDVIAGICAAIAKDFDNVAEVFLHAHSHAVYIVEKLNLKNNLIDAQNVSESLHLK